MINLDIFEDLPEISLIKDADITLKGIQDEMVTDFEAKATELRGENVTLVPTDDRRIMLDIIGGELYQICQLIDMRFKQNFIQYMTGDVLKNWGYNLGFFDTGEKYASCTVQFTLSAIQATNVTIPSGTRVTAGDDVYFATNKSLVIAAGETQGEVTATCTTTGSAQNGYAIGQLSTIVDPVNYVQSVTNTTTPTGGHDEYTDDELKYILLNYPSTYSTAGSKDGYIEKVMVYSPDIADCACITTTAGTVSLYYIYKNGVFPTVTQCEAVKEYLEELGLQPDTDMISVSPPTQVSYTIELTYYISELRKSNEADIKEAAQDAIDEFITETQESIGKAISPDQLLSYILAAGACRVEITAPTYTAITGNSVGICTNTDITYGGTE